MFRSRMALQCLVSTSLLGVLLLGQLASARACSLDGIASLSANGHTASLTGAPPTTASLNNWAPFTLLAAAPGDDLHLAEDLGKLRATLPAAAFAQPFRWAFGDGVVTYGREVTHRYARLGWYKITLSYARSSGQHWIVFDSARVQMVPQSDLLQTNLGYYIALYLQRSLQWLVWATILVLAGAALWMRIRTDHRRRRVQPPPGARPYETAEPLRAHSGKG